VIRKILHSRLPQRVAHRVPPVVVEVTVGLAAAIALVALRIPMNTVAGDRAPYSLNFVAVVLACVVAGWRSGLVALVVGQLLIWYFVVPYAWDFRFANRELLAGFVVATLSQLLILAVIALYQREIDKGVAERERRLTLLDDALREIDHRTRNNYQTVLAMIELQARRSSDQTVRDALTQVGDRIQAVANASQQLAKKSVDIDSVRLDDHLCGLVQQIERGLSRDGIDVACEVEEVTASADTATSISIIVNEIVTNAIKHAFNGEGSGHVSVVGRSGSSFELTVSDNGRGIEASRRDGHAGLGSKLVESFAKQLRAKHEVVSTDKGTMHRLVIPSLQGA
jgi:two-component sensor histidine kinase